ncbi:hypothetical protein HBI84_024690 [Parastagonospora nodorum]|nr:hypothetical protein HBI84_024690 [Parastagonospora nodorum]
MDLDFVPSIAFISNVYIADSLRARTLINLSAVLYKQAAARISLSAEVSNISSTSLRARTLINPSAVGIIDLNFVLSVAFDAIENVELTGNLLGDADRVNNNNNNKRTALLAKQIKTDKNRKKSTHCQEFNGSSSLKLQKIIRDNIEKLIYISKVKHIYVQAYTIPYSNLKKYLGNSTENSRYDYYNLQNSDSLTQIQAIDPIISKSDEVPTREPSSYIKIELLCDNSRKFYRLVITSEDTHCKQIIKKAYIMLLERALLILFIT